MNPTMTPYLAGLINVSPVLLAYLAGLVAALTLWGQYPRVCMLVMIASIILLATTIGQQLLSYSMMNQMRSSGWSAQQYSVYMTMVALVGNILRGVGFGILIWAAFVERPVPIAQVSAFETLPPR
jgi:hypothetical protein